RGVTGKRRFRQPARCPEGKPAGLVPQVRGEGKGGGTRGGRRPDPCHATGQDRRPHVDHTARVLGSGAHAAATPSLLNLRHPALSHLASTSSGAPARRYRAPQGRSVLL